MILIPTSKASYSSLLLEALNPSLKECSNHTSYGVMMTIPALAPIELDMPSTNTLHGRHSI